MRGQLSTDTKSIRKAFEEIDKNGDGFLDSGEIAQISMRTILSVVFEMS